MLNNKPKHPSFEPLNLHPVVDKDLVIAEITADLCWCLGLLEGIGHPVERLNEKYLLAQTKPTFIIKGEPMTESV